METLISDGLSAPTIRFYGFAVKTRLLHLEDEKQQDHDTRVLAKYEINQTFRSFKMPRIASRRVDIPIPSVEQIRQAILKSADERWGLVVEFFVTTGIRVSELTAIRVAHVKRIDDKIYRVRIMGKGRKQRHVRVSVSLIKRIVSAFSGQVYLFEITPGKRMLVRTVRQWIQKAGTAGGIYLHPHLLRHYFATTTLKRTGDLSSLSRYLGHSDESTTVQNYIHGGGFRMEDVDPGLWGEKGRVKGKKEALSE